MAGMGCDATVEMAESIAQKEVVNHEYAEGGEFLPLSVWERAGSTRNFLALPWPVRKAR